GIRDWSVTGVQTCALPISDEPIAMIVPQRRGALEGVEPRIAQIAEDEQALEGVQRFARSREAFWAAGMPGGWQGHYHRGQQTDEIGRASCRERAKRRGVGG